MIPKYQFRVLLSVALHARQVSRVETHILMALWGHTRGGEGVGWPSHETLAEQCACSTKTVKRALNRLKKIGWVSWEHHYERQGPRMVQSSNRYRLHPPAWMAELSELTAA
jgi:predicted transcriptional regulator